MAKPWLTVLVMLVVVLAVLELTNTTHLLHRQKAVSGRIPSASNQATSKADKSSSQPAAANQSAKAVGISGSSSNSSSTTPAGSLTAPYGTFVSNHKPSLSGTSSPSQEQSVCTTSAGAACYIEFTQGDVTKTLQSQTADSSGSTTWTWDVKQAGLVEGKWTITAIASLGNLTKSTVDQISLEVQP